MKITCYKEPYETTGVPVVIPGFEQFSFRAFLVPSKKKLTMPKKVYKLTRIPFKKGLNKIQTTSRSKLDWGTMNDLRDIDEYFTKLFADEAEKIKKLGLDVNSLSLSIAQLSNIG